MNVTALLIGATIILTVFNSKGGSGKTPTVVHLAYALARAGYRVLLCDLDQQATASFHFLGLKFRRLQPTIYTALRDLVRIEPIPIISGLDLLPAHDELAGLEIDLPKMKQKNGKALFWQGRLAELLNLYPGYDFLLCDTPGSAISIFPTMALTSADLAIIPVKSEIAAVVGTQESINLLNDVRTASEDQERPLNPNVTLWGILPNQFEARTVSHQEALRLLHKLYPDSPIYPVPARKSTLYNEATANHLDIRETDPKIGPVLGAYWDVIAADIINRSRTIVKEKQPA